VQRCINTTEIGTSIFFPNNFKLSIALHFLYFIFKVCILCIYHVLIYYVLKPLYYLYVVIKDILSNLNYLIYRILAYCNNINLFYCIFILIFLYN